MAPDRSGPSASADDGGFDMGPEESAGEGATAIGGVSTAAEVVATTTANGRRWARTDAIDDAAGTRSTSVTTGDSSPHQ